MLVGVSNLTVCFQGRSPLREWNVVDRASISVEDHLVWKPIDDLVPIVVDEGIPDVNRAQVRCLYLDICPGLNPFRLGHSHSIGLSHLLLGLVLLDRYITLFAVLHAYPCDLSIGDLGRDSVLAVLVDHVLSVGLDMGAKHLLPVLVLVGLGKGGTNKSERDDGDHSTQKTL